MKFDPDRFTQIKWYYWMTVMSMWEVKFSSWSSIYILLVLSKINVSRVWLFQLQIIKYVITTMALKHNGSGPGLHTGSEFNPMVNWLIRWRLVTNLHESLCSLDTLNCRLRRWIVPTTRVDWNLKTFAKWSNSCYTQYQLLCAIYLVKFTP